MSAGKMASQAAHAETLAVDALHHLNSNARNDARKALYREWLDRGMATYVMEAEDATQIYSIERYLTDKGYLCYPYIDEGHTENTVFVPTAMSIELIDKDIDRDKFTFSEFKLYKDDNKTKIDKALTEFHWGDLELKELEPWTPTVNLKPYSWRLADAGRCQRSRQKLI